MTMDPTDPKYCAGWGAGYRAAQADFEAGKQEFTASSQARIQELYAALDESNRLLGSLPIYKDNPRVAAAIEANRRALHKDSK